MDPVSGVVAISGLLGGSAFFGVANTIARRFISDKASIESLKLRREELQRADERFRRELDERRRLKLDELRIQFENQVRLGELATQRQHELQQEEWRVQRWPLSVLPSDFIMASKACSGYATNVVIKVAPSFGDNAAMDGPSARIAPSIVLNSGPVAALERLFYGHQSRVLLYNETHSPSRQTERGLTVTLWSMLHTEPTILVEVDTSPGGNLILRVSLWGASTQNGDIVSTSLDEEHRPHIFAELGTVSLALSPQPQERAAAVSFQLALTVSLLVDALAILQRPQELTVPIFGTLLEDSHIGSLPAAVWQPLSSTFESIYDVVALHSPVVAAESAAVAALSLDAVGQKELAASFVGVGLKYFRRAIRELAASDGRVLDVLIRARGGNDPSALERAMRSIRGVAMPQATAYPDLAKLVKVLGH